MSEGKHTPGPWWVAGDMPGEQELFNPVVRGMRDGTTRITICRTGQNNHQPYEWANARLIAAAPELLAVADAVEKCLGMAGIDAVDGSLNPLEALRSSARAAIAKAKGEA